MLNKENCQIMVSQSKRSISEEEKSHDLLVRVGINS